MEEDAVLSDLILYSLYEHFVNMCPASLVSKMTSYEQRNRSSIPCRADVFLFSTT
jgi:hypothetical protein